MADATTAGTETKVEAPKPAEAGTDTQKSYWEIEARKAFEARDAAKAKLKEFELAAEAARAEEIEEKGLFKQELDKVKPEYESLKKWKAEVDARLAEDISALETKMDASHRDEYERFIKALSPEQRRDWLTAKAASAPSVPATSPGAGRPGTTGKTQAELAALPFEERIKLFKADPKAFK